MAGAGRLGTRDAANPRVRARFHAAMVFAERGGPPLRIAPERGVLTGVCAGIAAWLSLDPWLVRILFVLISVLSSAFPGMLVYLALLIGLPRVRE